MAGNTTPIFSRIGIISASAIGTTAAVSSSGVGTIGTNIFNVFTADATNGSFVQRIRFSPSATTAATSTAATVHRIYVSSVSTGATTQANAWLFQEVACAAQSAAATTTATAYVEVPLNFALPPNYTILVNSSVVNNANTSWTAIVFGGAY